MAELPTHPAPVVAEAAPAPAQPVAKPLNVLMVGTGEYTTGFVGTGASGSDKKVGVVGLTMFDLRRRGKVGKLSMVGTSGSKYPAIRTPLYFFSPHLTSTRFVACYRMHATALFSPRSKC
jgi:D-galacturonate reductase